MDILTVIGVIIGFAAIIGGNFLEGGHLSALVNGPAALIVLGGTIGAAVLQTPKDVLLRSVKLFVWMMTLMSSIIRLLIGLELLERTAF